MPTVDRLAAMELFVTVAELSSFAAAARRLSMSPARVTRAIAALEARIGARLLHRTTRVVRLTETGASYLIECKRILGQIDEAEARAASAEGEPIGRLTVTAPSMFGKLYVAPILLEFLRSHPRVSVRALFGDRVLDLYEQNIDVAVRIAHLADSNLMATRVGAVRRVVCASPAYLSAHGVPRTPSDLAGHTLVSFAGLGEPRVWHFEHHGRVESIAPRSRLLVDSVELAILAARAGEGLAWLPSYPIVDDVRTRRLRIVLAEYERPPLPVHVVHREAKGGAVRVRAFVALATARLRAAFEAGAGKLTTVRRARASRGDDDARQH